MHSAAQVTPQNAVSDIANRRADARQMALLEQTPPPLESPLNPEHDRARFNVHELDRISAVTSTDAPGLLVLSEVSYPAWTAYVDDGPARVYYAP